MKDLPTIDELTEQQKKQLKNLTRIKEFKVLEYEEDDGLPCINCNMTDQDGYTYKFFVGWIEYKNLGHWQYVGKHEDADKFVIKKIKSLVKELKWVD